MGAALVGGVIGDPGGLGGTVGKGNSGQATRMAASAAGLGGGGQ
jgi:hypothetical protein